MGYRYNKCGIYRIYFIGSNKSYIGLSKGFKGRRVQHLRELRKGTHFNIYLQRAFNKYGENNFRIELIEECYKTELTQKEKHYIEIYDSFKNGYNLTTGGENCNISDDVKKRISEKHKGKIIKEETRQKLRQINLGKSLTKEHKNKISIANKYRVFTDEQRQKIIKAVSYKRSKETKEKMSKAMIGKDIDYKTKLKLAAFNLKRTRPNSLIEIKNEKVYIDGYEYIQGKRTPPEQEIFEKEKLIRKAEGIKKRVKSMTGRKASQETRQKISKALKGRKMTPEQNKANSERQKGIKRSEEFKQKLRDYNKRKREKAWVGSQNF
jgi:group I intron endonuclease